MTKVSNVSPLLFPGHISQSRMWAAYWCRKVWHFHLQVRSNKKKTKKNRASHATAISFVVTQSARFWGPFETKMDKTRTYWWYMLSCNQTFIALLYLQDQEDLGGLHRPENTTETKYQSPRTCSNKQKWQEGDGGEKHGIKLYKRNNIRKQVATDDLEQLEQLQQQWRRQVIQKGGTKNQIIILLYCPIWPYLSCAYAQYIHTQSTTLCNWCFRE